MGAFAPRWARGRLGQFAGQSRCAVPLSSRKEAASASINGQTTSSSGGDEVGDLLPLLGGGVPWVTDVTSTWSVHRGGDDVGRKPFMPIASSPGRQSRINASMPSRIIAGVMSGFRGSPAPCGRIRRPSSPRARRGCTGPYCDLAVVPVALALARVDHMLARVGVEGEVVADPVEAQRLVAVGAGRPGARRARRPPTRCR